MSDARPPAPALERQLERARAREARARQMLQGIRRLHEVMTRRSDPQGLIESACRCLVDDLDYAYAWVALVADDGDTVTAWASCGPQEVLGALRARLAAHDLPACMTAALRHKGPVAAGTAAITCAGCPMVVVQPAQLGVAQRLEVEETVYGVLVACLPQALGDDPDERSLLSELSVELSLGLHHLATRAAMRESETLYRVTFDRAALGVAHVALDGRWLRVNQALCDIVGYSREELLTKTFQDITHPDDLTADLEHVARLLDGQADRYAMEKRYLRRDGSTVWIHLTVSIVRDPEGAPLFFISAVEDIDRRKRAEANAAELRERLRLAMESAEEGIWEWDYDTGLVSFDPVTLAMLGFPATFEPQPGEWWMSRVHPDDLEAMSHAYAAYTEGRAERYAVEFRMRRRDGGYTWVASTAQIVRRYPDGSPRLVVGIHRDINARQVNEAALRSSRELLARAEEIAQMGSWAYDVETQEVTWSDGLFHLLGIDPAEGPPAYADHESVFLPEDVARERQAVDRAIREGTPYEITLRTRRADGALRHCIVRGEAVRGPAGRVARLEGSFQDITERWRVQQALREREAESRAMLNNMLNAFVLFDSVYDESGRFVSYRFVTINKAYERITGVLNDEVRGKTVHEVWPATEPSWIEKYGEVATTGVTQTFDMYHDPTKKLYHCTVYRPWPHNRRFCVIFEDITESDRARKEIASLARFPAENPYPVLRLSAEGMVLYTNEAGRVLLEHWQVADQGKLPETWCESVRDALCEGTARVRETRVGQVDYDLNLVPVLPDGFVNVYGLDVSERVRARERQNRLNEELEARVRARTAELAAANEELEAFAYSVSHDLRSPLRGIDGYAHILQQDYAKALDEDGRFVLVQVRESARDMGRLIDDLLAYSRMGRRAPRMTYFQMSPIMERVIQELNAAYPRQRIEFIVGDLPSAHGDPAMLEHVWLNLLDNAAKFSRTREVSRIEIGARPNAQCPLPNPELPENIPVYYVRDNGVGYDARYADKLFQVFQRLHGTNEFEGTGIGLAIVQRVVRRHGGTVWSQGAVDQGATFCFALNIEGERP